MKITKPKFHNSGPLIGMRSVYLEKLPSLKWREELPDLFGKVGPDTMVILGDKTEKLSQAPMYPFLKHTKLKGLRFAHFAQEGLYPEWLEYLDHTIIKIYGPRDFKSGDDFNEAVQDLWFMRGQLHIWVSIVEPSDLDMTELLYSYTPNDVPFWVDIDQLKPECKPEILVHLLSRRFATVRVI